MIPLKANNYYTSLPLLGAGLKDYNQFKTDLGQRESGNNYSVVNSYGFMGKYQFGLPRLRDLGYTGTKQAFISDPQLQEQYFDKHVQDHAKNLVNKVAAAQAKYGSWVTLSGLIAGAHLKGRGGVSQWINGNDNSDANGTTVSSYVTKFSGYAIPGYDESTGEAHGAVKSSPASPVFDIMQQAGFDVTDWKTIAVTGALIAAGLSIFLKRKKYK